MAASVTQRNHAEAGAGVASVAVALTGVAAGPQTGIVVSVKAENNAAATVTVSDGTTGFTPGTLKRHTNTNQQFSQYFYLPSANSGNKTYTATFSGNVDFASIHVWEVNAGTGFQWAFDAEPSGGGASGAGTAPNSGNMNATGPAGIAFGTYAEFSGATMSAPLINGAAADFSFQFPPITTATGFWDKTYAAPFNGAASCTLDAAPDWVCMGLAMQVIATFTTDQEGTQFGNDDANEATHTFAASQDASITSLLGTALLIRALINGTGDPASAAYALRYQKNGAGGYSVVPVGTSTAPTLSFGAIGTVTVNANPSFPSGATTNSMFVLLVGQKPTTANGGGITTPTGWTLNTSRTGANDGDTGGYTTTLGADTGNCNIFAYTKDAITGTETGAVTVTAADNNVFWAVIIRLESSDRCTWSFDASSGKDTSAGSVSIATAAMAIASGDYVIGAMVIPTDVTTPAQFSAESFTQTGTTFGAITEHIEPDSTTGNDIGGFVIGGSATAGSGAGAVTMAATAGGTTTNVRGPGIVLRARVTAVANDVYVSPSANITAGGEATTARLAAPSGKTTGDFVTGRRWDDENGSDSIDITTDDYTEVEWCVNTQSPSVNGDFYDFRVYSGSSALSTYSVTPRWTLGTPGVELPPLTVPPMLASGSRR